MDYLYRRVCLLFFCCFIQIALGQNVMINELSQSNVDEVMVNSDFPESWVELFNRTDNEIDLKNYRLSLVNEYSQSKALKGKIPAHGYAIIYCDVSWSEGHFPYRLESDAPGRLYLFAGSKKVDEVEYPAMLAPGIAYGRTTDGGSTWKHEIVSTPGKTNNGGHFSELLLPDPVFSVIGGIKTSAQTLKVTIPSGEWPSDTKIYYTLDGSEPTINSTSTKSLNLQIDRTTIVRAKIMSSEALSRRSITQSYLFLDRPTNLPVFSIAVNKEFLEGDLGIITHYKAKWRRPINVECYDTNNSSVLFNQLGETALSGGGSREFAQKSMKCYAKKWFGVKRFHGNFWEDKPNVSKSKSFILRNGGNNSNNSKINDAFVQKIFGTHLQSLDWQAYEPAIVYINGEYMGLFEWRERSNDDYVFSNYDGLEAIVSAEANHYTSKTPPDLFKSFRDAYCKEATTYEDLAKLMDIENFMDALIAEMYAANTDYPGNNIFMWRPSASGGRWRWILKDLDYMARNNVSYDMFAKMFSQANGGNNYVDGVVSPGNYSVYRKMISFPLFREQFIKHFAVYLGDFMKPSYAVSLLDEMVSEIESEIAPTQSVYGYTASWSNAVNKLRTYCEQRPDVLYSQMASFFSLGNVIPMKLTNNGKEIKVNDIPLTEGDFDGSYFSGFPLSISTNANNYGWRMTVTKSDGKTETYDFKAQNVNLKLGDYGSIASVLFEPLQLGQSDFERMLADTGLQKSMKNDYTKTTIITLPEPSCAYANLTGLNVLPSSKDDVKNAYLEVYDGRGNYFKKKVLVSLQGGESSNLYKKNFSVSFCEDEWIGDETPDITFGDWVKQDEFHLKGFYNDYFRGIPAIGYKLYNQMLRTHSDGEQYAWQRGLSTSDLSNESLNIYNEARCFPDAFPCVLYHNGDYYGTFAWQLKKQRRNMNQTKDIATHIHLDGTLNDKQLFQGDVNWTKFEVRNPKDLYNMDGSDYDGDNPQELIDATSAAYTGKKKMVRCAEVKQHILDLSRYYDEIRTMEENGVSADKVRDAINRRFDVTGLIDYLILSLVTSNYDGLSKKWQWFTYDADKWFVAPYDLDLTFGYNEEYQELWPASQSSKKYDYRMQNVDSNGPMYWIKQYYWEEVRLRYAALRNSGVLTTSNIMSIVNDWYNRIGDKNRSQEWQRWPESPCLTNFTDSPDRMKQWISNRLSLEDDYLGYTSGSSSYAFIMNAGEWATLCLPFGYTLPSGLVAYTVDGVNGDGATLRLVKESHPSANKPYLVHGAAGTYRLNGSSVNASGALENGLLNGTYTDIFAPADSYVLQNRDGVIGFYHVSGDVKMPVGAYRAYLKTGGSHPSSLRLEDPAALDNVISNTEGENYTIYNLWGQQIDKLQQGVGVVRYSNGKTKTIIK